MDVKVSSNIISLQNTLTLTVAMNHQQNWKRVWPRWLRVESFAGWLSVGLSRAYNVEGSRNSLDEKPGGLSYWHIHSQTFSFKSCHFIVTSATYLQPESLGYHAYVDTDKHHSIWPIRLRHDESATVQPGEDAPCVLASLTVAHLERKRESQRLSASVPCHQNEMQLHKKRPLRKGEVKHNLWPCVR